jgi:hypothetical protein
MTILTELNATAQAGEIHENRGILQQVQDEPVRGFFRIVKLGGSALYMQRGERVVAIPRAELFKLAEAADAAFLPPAPQPEPTEG